MLARLSSILLSLSLCHASLARACPSCPIGRAARSQVCGQDFVAHLSAVLLPFIVLALLSLWVERTIDSVGERP